MLDVSADRRKLTNCTRLVIADPQPIVLQGLKSVFATQKDFEIVASCDCGASCLQAIRNLAPDVALVGGTLPDLTVSEILAIAKAENLPTQFMFFAESEGDEDLSAAIASGACNAVSPYADPDTIVRSLRLATERAGTWPKPSQDLAPNEKDVDGTKVEKMLGALTHRERQIVQLVSEGLSNKEIARELNVSRGTVKVHLYNIFQKLEISNRTVLATIALLQRSTGFTSLSLALAFAILSEVKPSEASKALPDDDSAARKDRDHSIFELTKAMFPHIVVADAGETIALNQRVSCTKETEDTQSVARMEGLHGVGQVALSHFGRGYGPIGSGPPPPSVPPLQQAINNYQAGTLTSQNQLLPLQFASSRVWSHGGYGSFAMAAAGIALSALDTSQAAAQDFEPSETQIDPSAVANRDGATQMAAIDIHVAGKVAAADADNLASVPLAHDSDPSLTLTPPGNESVIREGSAHQVIHVGPGDSNLEGSRLINDTIHGSGDTINGNDAVIGGDKATGSAGEDVLAHPSAADSNGFETGIDLISGTDRINLAAFGALAFLHLTSASQSVPPHTLAWIYNPVSNVTIVYVNPTDRSLDIGDAGLLEIHLQGVVSVAELDFVPKPDAAAVAAALAGIDPTLLLVDANDLSALAEHGADASSEMEASESAFLTAGVWTMPAEDSFRFHFGLDRPRSSDWTRLASFDNSEHGTDNHDAGAGIIPVHISPIEPVKNQAIDATEANPAFKKGYFYTNTGAETIGPSNPHANAGLLLEMKMQDAAIETRIETPVAVEETSGSTTDNGRGHDSSQHPSQSATAKASNTDELAERGGSSDHAKPDHASKSASAGEAPTAALTGPGDAPGHSNSQHPSQAAAKKTSLDVEPTESAGPPSRGNSDHPSGSAPVKASVAAELAASSDPPGHGNSERPSHLASVKAAQADKQAEPDATPGNASHSNSHSSHQASVSAIEPPAPVELNAAAGHGVDHRNAKIAPSPAAEQKSAGTDFNEPSDAPIHGNSNPASVSELAAGDHGNPSHALHTVSNPSAVIHQPTEPAPETSGAAPDPAFHFRNQAPSPGPTAEVELTDLHDPPMHGAELTAILETDPAPSEVHGNGHVQSGQHHALAHSPHELLP